MRARCISYADRSVRSSSEYRYYGIDRLISERYFTYECEPVLEFQFLQDRMDVRFNGTFAQAQQSRDYFVRVPSAHQNRHFLLAICQNPQCHFHILVQDDYTTRVFRTGSGPGEGRDTHLEENVTYETIVACWR
jgi:hypothetical protein